MNLRDVIFALIFAVVVAVLFNGISKAYSTPTKANETEVVQLTKMQCYNLGTQVTRVVTHFQSNKPYTYVIDAMKTIEMDVPVRKAVNDIIFTLYFEASEDALSNIRFNSPDLFGDYIFTVCVNYGGKLEVRIRTEV